MKRNICLVLLAVVAIGFVLGVLPQWILAARGTLTVIDAPTSWAVLGASVTWTTGDVSNGHEFTSTGREFVLMRNFDDVTQGATIQSVADSFGRTGDTGYAVPADSGTVVFQVFPTAGWQQSDGMIYIDVSSEAISLAVIRLP